MSAAWREPVDVVDGRRPVHLAVTIVLLALAGAGVALGWFAGEHTARDAAAMLVTGLRTAGVVTACGAVGSLVVAVLVVPPGRSEHLVSHHARAAVAWSVAWAAVSVLWAGAVLVSAGAGSAVVHGPPGEDAAVVAAVARTAVVTAWAASVVAVLARTSSARVLRVALLLAYGGVAGMVMSGHAVHADDRAAAVVSMLLHVAAVTTWVGGLLALALQPGRVPVEQMRRFGLLALVCFGVVGLSGGVNLLTRTGLEQLAGSGAYLWLLLAKVASYVLLGAAGAVHRAWTVRRLDAGLPRSFLLVVVGELLLMATAAGFAVVLAASGA